MSKLPMVSTFFFGTVGMNFNVHVRIYMYIPLPAFCSKTTAGNAQSLLNGCFCSIESTISTLVHVCIGQMYRASWQYKSILRAVLSLVLLLSIVKPSSEHWESEHCESMFYMVSTQQNVKFFERTIYCKCYNIRVFIHAYAHVYIILCMYKYKYMYVYIQYIICSQ